MTSTKTKQNSHFIPIAIPSPAVLAKVPVAAVVPPCQLLDRMYFWALHCPALLCTILVLSFLRPSQKTFSIDISELYSIYAITMTCFDLCPHQMVSLQLLNPPSPPGSCLQTTFGFTHPLIFKNKHPSGVFAFLHFPLPPHLLLLAATLRSSATRPGVTVTVSGGGDGEEDLHPGMHHPPSPLCFK